MKSILDGLSRLALTISAASLIVMTATITYQVVARYVFNDSPAWSERLSLVLLAYLVFFGAAVGVHEKYHIRIDAIRNSVPPRFAWILDLTAHAAVAVAGLVMVFAGWQLVTTLWQFSIPALGIPRGLALLPILMSGGLITLFSVAHFVETFGQSPEEAR